VDRLLLELYARENDLTVKQVMATPRWLDRVRATYDGRGGLPPLKDGAFYGAVFDRVFPERDLRARFLEEILDGHAPHFGHHILAAMMCTGIAALVITTNFDHLIEDAAEAMRAYAGGERLTVLEPDNSSRTAHILATGRQPLLAKVHGDLGSVTVMNTDREIIAGDERLRAAVRSKLSRYGLIVAGYSGRDPAIMRMLEDVLDHDTPYPSGLTWARRPEDDLAASVRALLDRARNAGVEPVQEVVAAHFGELMSHLRRAITLPERVEQRLDALRPPPVRAPAPMPAAPVRQYPQIRLGAVEVTTLPIEARLLDVPPKTQLTEVRGALKRARARANVAVVDGRHVAFGRDADLSTALAPLGGRVTADTIPLDLQNSTTAIGLITESLALACGRLPGLSPVLRSNQRHQVRISDQRRDQPGPTRASATLATALGGEDVRGSLEAIGTTLPWAEAITLSLQQVLGRWHLLFAPDIWIRLAGDTPEERAHARRVGAQFTRSRLAPRYTRQTGALLGAWLSLIAATPLAAWGLAAAEGIDATFTLSTAPLTSRQADGADLLVNGATQ